ncbi:MAG: GUN4 domain-containing protein [Cyanobacteria bacterium P01_F01_bin.4]
MQRFWAAGLLAGMMLGSVADGRVDVPAVIASAQPTLAQSIPAQSTLSQSAEASSPQRYDIYLGDQFGLRFVYPEGYRVDSATSYRSTDPENELQLSLDLWKDADYLPWGGRYQEQADETEAPPHISIDVFRNPDGRPLREWLDEAVFYSEQVITVAGQGAFAASSTNLYDVVLVPTPDDAHIVRLQADYLDENDPMRQVFQDVLASLAFDQLAEETATRIDYSPLQTLLAEQSWRVADLETRAILMRLISSYDYLYPGIDRDGITAMSCGDIQIMDALWSQYSDGRFGLKAQATLWKSLSTADPQQRAAQLGQQVGWLREEPLPAETLGLEVGGTLWRLDTEVQYDMPAPVGHLPWPGVSSLMMERMLQESGAGCGSCSIDVMYLSSDRFADYLDAFLARVDECLCSGESAGSQFVESP